MESCPAPFAECPSPAEDPWTLAFRAAELNEACAFEEAMSLCLRALARDPGCWGAWCNLGNALTETCRFDDAIAAYANCLRLYPDAAHAAANMGVALFRRGAPRPAVTFLELAAAADPDNAETRCNLAQALLSGGDYARGFAEYEWRWRTQAMAALAPRTRAGLAPMWQGEEFDGRTLLLTEEGGLGDTLQFIRYAPLAKGRGGRVVLHARRPLLRLLARMDGIDAVAAAEEAPPAHDLRCPLLSLPALFGTTVGTVPAPSGYLRPDPALARSWASRVGSAGEEDGPRALRVGLVWAGAPRPGMRGAALADGRRSMKLADFAPLAACRPDLELHSLQVGEAAAQALAPPAGMTLRDQTASITDFEDTAAVVAALDLVIAVDTSTAHLAGALGRPVWLLSRHDMCWRWLAGRQDTPWYAGMRVFRQTRPHDWSETVAEVATALAAFRREALAPPGVQGVGASSVEPV